MYLHIRLIESWKLRLSLIAVVNDLDQAEFS